MLAEDDPPTVSEAEAALNAERFAANGIAVDSAAKTLAEAIVAALEEEPVINADVINAAATKVAVNCKLFVRVADDDETDNKLLDSVLAVATILLETIALPITIADSGIAVLTAALLEPTAFDVAVSGIAVDMTLDTLEALSILTASVPPADSAELDDANTAILACNGILFVKLADSAATLEELEANLVTAVSDAVVIA